MKIRITALLIALILLSACAKSREYSASAPNQAPPAGGAVSKSAIDKKAYSADSVPKTPAPTSDVTPASLETTVHADNAIARKIIRNAEIDLEVDKPQDGYNQISAIANSHGGFVITSESKQYGESGQSISIILRVPTEKFDKAVSEIRSLGAQVLREKITGEDVTEEFIDLEARLKTKRALEEQYLEIMKHAQKISDILEVQEHLTAVRTEIEQIEGRRRFLENQSSLSTITVSLQPHVLIVKSSSSFYNRFKHAVADGIDITEEIVLGAIRLMGVLLPMILFLGLPIFIVYRIIRRRKV